MVTGDEEMSLQTGEDCRVLMFSCSLLSHRSPSLTSSLALYSRSQRGHLFHFCRLVSVILPDSPESDKKEKTTAIIREHANTEEIEAMVKKYEDRLDV